MSASENDVKRSCLDYLRLRGHIAIRINNGAQVNEYQGKRRFFRFTDVPGSSDIIGCTNRGTFYAVECKRPGRRGQVSDLQAAFLAAVEAAGGIAIVAESVDDLVRAGL